MDILLLPDRQLEPDERNRCEECQILFFNDPIQEEDEEILCSACLLSSMSE